MRRHPPSPIGIRLRRLREAAKLSQRELARLAGVSPAYPRALESGFVLAPSAVAVQALAAVFGLDSMALLEPRELPSPLRLAIAVEASRREHAERAAE